MLRILHCIRMSEPEVKPNLDHIPYEQPFRVRSSETDIRLKTAVIGWQAKCFQAPCSLRAQCSHWPACGRVPSCFIHSIKGVFRWGVDRWVPLHKDI